VKFLSLEKEIFGLDISDRSLKLIYLKKKGKSFALASFNHIETEPGVIEGGIIKNEEALIKIIKALLKNVKGKKITTKYVAVSLPEEKSFLQVIQMPKMTDDELKAAIIFEAENYIPLPISEVYLDFQNVIPVKDHLSHNDVLIAATPKKIVNSYVAMLKKSGLVPVALEVESQAITRALVKNETSQSPIILIDFGKSSTIFIIFAGRSIQFTCSIPVSAGQITEAISTSMNIHLRKAEEIKMKYNLANLKANEKSKKILSAINPVLEDLVLQIKKYINFYQGHTSHEHVSSGYNIEKILLCGGGANLKGLTQFLSKELQIPVELGNFWTNFDSKKINHAFDKDSLSFVTALGLAMRGIHNIE